jgi:hypothetical protein
LLAKVWVGTFLAGLVLCRWVGRVGGNRDWGWLPSVAVAVGGVLVLGTLLQLVYHHQGIPAGQGTARGETLSDFLGRIAMHLLTLAAFPIYLLLARPRASLACKPYSPEDSG